MSNSKLASLSLIPALLIGLIALPGCTRIKVEPPAPQLFAPAPQAVTIGQIYTDYLNDPAAASIKYEGWELWFSQVTVGSYSASTEKYITISLAEMPGQLIGTFHNFLGDIIISYLLVTAYTPQKFQAGDIVEIVGTCKGIQNQIVTISIDYINMLGAGGAVTPGQGSTY
jgi:hypothetical protein